MVYKIGTRKSALAKTQTGWVADKLTQSGLSCTLVTIESEGDVNLTTPLYEIETQTPGLFTKQLEQALLDRSVDLCVHSLKDLPTIQPKSLRVGAVSERASAADCLIIHKKNWDKAAGEIPLAKGSRVGTSSLRREALLLESRPDLLLSSLRGNVPTRVKLVADGKLDAIVLAEAGLDRLKLDLGDLIRVSLNQERFVPAPGQGALAIEVRDDASEELKKGLEKVHNAEAAFQTRVERRILRALEGGCTLPLGVRCKTEGSGKHTVHAFLGVLEERGQKTRKWLSFQRFDISSSEEETLVNQTVQHLERFLSR